MSVEGHCINKLMDDAREQGFKLGRESLEAENKRLREALEKIVKAGTIPWKDSDAVHVEYWAQWARSALEGKK